MKTNHLLLLCVTALISLQGCAPVLVAGTATGAGVVHDRRTAGSLLEDQNIELKAMSALANDPGIKASARVSVTSYNQTVLLSGQTPTTELRNRAEEIVSSIAKVRRVHNELALAAPSAVSARSSDAWITTKVKANLFKVKLDNFDPTRVKVVTENGTVFLMGLLTRSEADAVVEVVREISGVQRVVKLFEYIS